MKRWPEVVLVNPPMADLERPSLGLGLLKAILERDGLSVRILDAHLQFAREIGLTDYQRLHGTELGDWVFAAAAFAAPTPSPEDQAAGLVALSTKLAEIGEDTRDFLMTVRRMAAPWVEGLAERIVAGGPRIVGCTSLFRQHPAALAILRHVRALAPDIVTMIGGGNCEGVMGQTTHQTFDWVDYVVSGEADDLITPLCRLALDHGRDIPANDLPTGVFAPCHRDVGYPEPMRAVSHSFPAAPPPDYEDYFAEIESHEVLRGAIHPSLPLESSRGCWWGEKSVCTFCGLNGQSLGFRAKTADKVLADMRTLSERHHLPTFLMADNVLGMEYFDSLLPALVAQGAPYRIFYETKANLSAVQLKILHAAGVRHIQPGIESLDSRLLRLMGKGIAAWQNIQLLKHAQHQGIGLYWNLLAGFPGEDEAPYADMTAIIPLLSHLQPPNGVTPLQFQRHSVYFNHADRYGLALTPHRLYASVYPLAPEVIEGLALVFEDRHRREAEAFALLGLAFAGPCRYLPALIAAVDEWRSGGCDGLRPELRRDDDADGITIVDTRPVSTAPHHRLEGLAARLYALADAAPPRRRIREEADAWGVEPSDVDAIVDDLLARKLIVSIDGRLVALAVPPPLHAIEDFDPVRGMVDFANIGVGPHSG